MRRITIVPGMLVSALAGLVLAASAAPAAAVTQSKLEAAGWTCIQPLPVTDEPHCIRPHRLALMFSGEARTTTFLVFDLGGRFLGTEVNLRGDIYRKGEPPCPTDPPTFEYTHLLPVFGIDYYACHRFDSDHL
jgi:hypothetical protein